MLKKAKRRLIYCSVNIFFNEKYKGDGGTVYYAVQGGSYFRVCG